MAAAKKAAVKIKGVSKANPSEVAPKSKLPKSEPAKPGRSRPASSRDTRKIERRGAILDAALEEFSTRGFADTRLDDVAKRAGVAKGTIYLYFADKDSLFQELVRAMLSPVVGRLTAPPTADLPTRVIVETIINLFIREVLDTRRKDVIRLIITEGQRFPQLAEVYYREVISQVLPVLRALMARAVERGELRGDALVRFPQLLVAPAVAALMWEGLFGRIAPLDARELMQAQIELIFGERNAA